MGLRALALSLTTAAMVIIIPEVHAEDSCPLKRVAELHADSSTGSVIITVQLLGQDAHLVVDTGSPINMIGAALAEKLKLVARRTNGEVIDAAGRSINRFVTVPEIGLNGMKASQVPFLVTNGMSGEDRIDGVFGASFLEAYDVELDLGHDKIGLFIPNNCAADPVYWTKDYDVVPFRIDQSMHPFLEATLDGHKLNAMVDTGSALTILSQASARRDFDLDPAGGGAKPDGNLNTGSGAQIPFYKHRFGEFDIGGAGFRNTEIAIARLHEDRTDYKSTQFHGDADTNALTQMTIGINHLRKIRAYFGFGAHRLYVSAANAS
jgi:predicted aspartyl protease